VSHTRGLYSCHMRWSKWGKTESLGSTSGGPVVPITDDGAVVLSWLEWENQ